MPIDEAQWVAQLQRYLVELETASTRTTEGQKEGTVILSSTIQDRLKDNLIERESLEIGARSQLAINAKPQWQIASRQVYYKIDPVPALGIPLRVGDFWLWPDPNPTYIYIGIDGDVDVSNLADPWEVPQKLRKPPIIKFPPFRRIPIWRSFFASAVPWKSDFKLTIQQEERDATIKITGGTAVLTVSAYTQQDAVNLEKYRQPWTDALAQANYGVHSWQFIPVNLRNLQASLDLATNHQSSPPKVTVNTDTGTATFLIELSELGAQVWKDALEQRQSSTIPGLCRCTGSYYVQLQDRMDVQQQQLSTSLGSLIADCGPEVMHVLNPQVCVETKILVEGNPIVDSVAVDWLPNTGGVPVSKIFDSTGGLLVETVTSQNLSAIEIHWKARVSFKTATWPIILQEGTLSAGTSLSEIVKPSSWIREYTMTTLFMVSPTQVSLDGVGFENIDVEAVFTFLAPYVQGGVPLATTFNPSLYNAIVKVPFPLYPGQSPTQVALVVTTKSKSDSKMLDYKTRVLKPEEIIMTAKISLNGQIEIRTIADAVSELSVESEVFGVLVGLEGIEDTVGEFGKRLDKVG